MSKDCLSHAFENEKDLFCKRICSACRYFDPTVETDGEGRCKYNPPTIVPLCEGGGYWPIIGGFESACSRFVKDWGRNEV